MRAGTTRSTLLILCRASPCAVSIVLIAFAMLLRCQPAFVFGGLRTGHQVLIGDDWFRFRWFDAASATPTPESLPQYMTYTSEPWCDSRDDISMVVERTRYTRRLRGLDWDSGVCIADTYPVHVRLNVRFINMHYGWPAIPGVALAAILALRWLSRRLWSTHRGPGFRATCWAFLRMDPLIRPAPSRFIRGRFFAALTTASGLVCLGLIAVWTWCWLGRNDYRWTSGTVAEALNRVLICDAGFALEHSYMHVPAEASPEARQKCLGKWSWAEKYGARTQRHALGFYLAYLDDIRRVRVDDQGHWVSSKVRQWEACVPFWFPLLATAVLPLRWLIRFRVLHFRRRTGLCECCGYDLRASKDRCPECGTPIPARSEPENGDIHN